MKRPVNHQCVTRNQDTLSTVSLFCPCQHRRGFHRRQVAVPRFHLVAALVRCEEGWADCAARLVSVMWALVPNRTFVTQVIVLRRFCHLLNQERQEEAELQLMIALSLNI